MLRREASALSSVRSCLDYDLSADPVHYWDQQLDLYADIQNHLLEMSVAPSESYSLYGKAVHSVVGGFLPEIGINAVYYLGGINNTYLHKYTDQTRRSRLDARNWVVGSEEAGIL